MEQIETGKRQGDDNIEQITLEDSTEALKKQINGKVSVPYKFSMEMIKNIGDRGLQKLLEVCNMTWKEEQIPRHWEIGLIVPFKEGQQGL